MRRWMKWRGEAALAGLRTRSRESPYQVQHDLQDLMQDLVGIVRREDEMQRALEGIAKVEGRAA
jgi:succinate dehydrogenase / fumarate reductase flavoprotein subunit